MPQQSHTSERIVIVGGGFAGLSSAVRLAQAGLPVTVLEQSKLGYAASTRNQGWLQSGAWFAPHHPQLARLCYDSLQETLQFCPGCVEPGYGSMIYISSSEQSALDGCTQAFEQVGLPYDRLSAIELDQSLPTVAPQQRRSGLRLPDRAFRPEVLLSDLAAAARNSGVEIRSETHVDRLLVEDGAVSGVSVRSQEQIRARMVILAAGTSSGLSFSQLFEPSAGRQSDYQLVNLKTHLRLVRPEVNCDPFCVIDAVGVNHLPHFGTSVFGTSRWKVVAPSDDEQIDADEARLLDAQLDLLFPDGLGADHEVQDWAGTTVQAMHVDQIQPGDAPLPTIIDHSLEPCRVDNVISIFPGRATLWSHLAEKVRVTVLDCLGSRSVETARPPWSVTKP
ncbi:MAG: FAD-dependent oxidoreductase [Planctomycetaceae bacterium]|nr:FAD-dependent oxidoreductase [Planctomycetaceae bacterium]